MAAKTLENLKSKMSKESQARSDKMTANMSGGLKRIAMLVKAQADAMLVVSEAEMRLKLAKDRLRLISEVDLPEAMIECEVSTFTTTDGLTVKLKPDVQCSIAVANREAAYKWLTDHDFGGLIKSEIDIAFNREELDEAERLAATLKEQGYATSMNQTIHPQTLKAFVKERIADTESNVEFPLDLFGARPYTVAVVSRAK